MLSNVKLWGDNSQFLSKLLLLEGFFSVLSYLVGQEEVKTKKSICYLEHRNLILRVILTRTIDVLVQSVTRIIE